MKHVRFLSWLFVAGLALNGCEKSEDPEPEPAPVPEKQELASPDARLTASTETSFSIRWEAVADAASYACDVAVKESGEAVYEAETAETGFSLEHLNPGTTYTVSVTALPAEDSEAFLPSVPCMLEVATAADPYDALPADMFEVKVDIACIEGIQVSFTPKDPLMLYSNILIDELYLTQDGLTDYDFRDQLVSVSNRMLEAMGSLDAAMKAEFFYLGPVDYLGFGGQPAGKRCFFAVMGLEYDEQTNTVSPATQITRSEIFEIEDELLPKQEPWAEMLDPVYKTYKSEKVIEVKIEPNEVAAGNAYGKVYPADYRNTHSDAEIIGELLSVNNMFDTWISTWDPYLRGAMAPGERKLFAVATMEASGAVCKKLNWMVLEAPDAIGGRVRIVESATGETGEGPQPEPEPEPEPTEDFTISVQVDGSSVSWEVTPADPDVYYFVYITDAENVATPEDAQANVIQPMFDYVERMVGPGSWFVRYDTLEEYMEDCQELFKGKAALTETGFDPGTYCICCFAADITLGADETVVKPIGTMTKKEFSIQ